MQNFDYHNPTHIVFGQDRLAELDRLVPQQAKVLVLYGGGSVERFGTLDKVLEQLGSRSVTTFAGIEPNPQFDTLMKAVDIVREQNIDFLLALGGGSPSARHSTFSRTNTPRRMGERVRAPAYTLKNAARVRIPARSFPSSSTHSRPLAGASTP